MINVDKLVEYEAAALVAGTYLRATSRTVASKGDDNAWYLQEAQYLFGWKDAFQWLREGAKIDELPPSIRKCL